MPKLRVALAGLLLGLVGSLLLIVLLRSLDASWVVGFFAIIVMGSLFGVLVAWYSGAWRDTD
jgi:uncharacterized YccA/Bax inhibitor family protein